MIQLIAHNVQQSSDLHHSIGQLLIIGFDGTEMSPGLAALLTRVQPAGVILFARNITGGEQTYKLLKDCQACVSTPLFTAVDMEGGRVDRFRNVLGRSPSAADVFATGDRKLFRKHGKVIGESCRTLGFNTDFAPVVDLAFEASKTVMSSRAVSADPKQAVLYAREFLKGLASANVVGSAKHFPGLGEGQPRHSHGTPVHQQVVEESLGRRLVSLPDAAPRAAHGSHRTRQLSRDHPRSEARHRSQKSGSPTSCEKRSAIAD